MRNRFVVQSGIASTSLAAGFGTLWLDSKLLFPWTIACNQFRCVLMQTSCQT